MWAKLKKKNKKPKNVEELKERTTLRIEEIEEEKEKNIFGYEKIGLEEQK